jgi:hypothetical protein
MSMNVDIDPELHARAKAAAALAKPKTTLSKMIADLLRAHLDGTDTGAPATGSDQANRGGGPERGQRADETGKGHSPSGKSHGRTPRTSKGRRSVRRG